MTPCGLVVDWGRSCYRVAVVCREGDPAYLVDWYWADEDAKVLELWTPFRSRNWEERFSEEGQLGEQPGLRIWRSGKKPANGFTGNANAFSCAEYHSDWWEDGLGDGEEVGPFDDSGVPLCCITGPPTPPIDLCGCTTAQKIKLTLHSPLNACLDGQEFEVTWDEDLGQWTNIGDEPQPCGGCFMELKFICINAFPTQWLLLLQFRATSGGPAEGCAGGSASVDFTNCLPFSTMPFQVWIPDWAPCSCVNGIVADTVTFDAEEVP